MAGCGSESTKHQPGVGGDGGLGALDGYETRGHDSALGLDVAGFEAPIVRMDSPGVDAAQADASSLPVPDADSKASDVLVPSPVDVLSQVSDTAPAPGDALQARSDLTEVVAVARDAADAASDGPDLADAVVLGDASSQGDDATLDQPDLADAGLGTREDSTVGLADAAPASPDVARDGSSEPQLWPALPTHSGSGNLAISGRDTSAIEVVVPSSRTASPPLILSFHPAGGEEGEGIAQFELDYKADQFGFIAIAPRAGYRRTTHPADVDHAADQGDSSWNMWDPDPATNEDLRYVSALIEAAHQSYGIDRSRVYTMGFANGGYFAYFVAASLPDQIAGFAENSGGWTTDACPSRYAAEASGASYVASSAPAGVSVGGAFACSVLFADASFPSACRASASNQLRPPPLSGRVPFGYLAHYSGDAVVSAQWSCILSESLGGRAETTIRFSEPDAWGPEDSVVSGHNVMPDFFDRSWAFFAGRSNSE